MTELDIAVELTKKAGQRIIEIYDAGDVIAWQKSDRTFLTQADVDSNDIIVDELKKIFPSHAILSEEEEDNRSRLSNEHLWIFDPLDGTSDFRSRTGDFAVMIAYAHKNEPVFGVVYVPVRDQLYTAEKGKGAFLTESGSTRRLRVIPRLLEESVIVLSRKEFTPEEAQEVGRKYGAKGAIQSGSFGVKVGLIAEGKADFYINNDTNAGEWDSAAPGLILKEAGGTITDYDGKLLAYNKPDPHLPRGAICSTGRIHEDILKAAEKYAPLKPRK